MFHRREVLVLGVAPLSSSFPLDTRAGDLYDDYINSTSKQPFVSFLGREGSPSSVGHAFVGVGVTLDATLYVYERFFGLYPASSGVLVAVKSLFTRTSGRLDVTWADVKWDTEFRRPIDDDQKAVVLSRFEKWTSVAPEYSLLANDGKNCNALVGDVAASVSLSVPSGAGTTRPWKYIEALKSANSR